MFWQIWFWLLVALFVLPFPFKIYEYATGKDDSPLEVKVEEMANLLFSAIGLIGYYGYIQQQSYLSPTFWEVWLVVGILWSLLSLFWSPKLAYGTQIHGARRMRWLMAISTLIVLPLYIAVYRYAF
ncbi:hypothetical protein JYB87_11015 [Shewanella avicenniae]|uniref:DUF1761 domain-containing protein n=1 Tax=Shewanella avicenniae TaxID=2814294 RepID=A0ABX7QMT2_9GAMM|nr:hypothetical protein [Shewanella avicenniae]QSX32305.1 hypothetical protein JYB87_11015 [Shewanella avicenniae]